MRQLILLVAMIFSPLSFLYSQEVKMDSVIYKVEETGDLILKVYSPTLSRSEASPAMVFYQGGGWKHGKVGSFENHAKYFTSRGFICFLAEYGAKGRTTDDYLDCIADAKSAMRFIHANAETFNIDESRIIAAGGSSGGHLAASLALVEIGNDPNDDLSISTLPAALVLFNPAVDFGPASPRLYASLGDEYSSISPLHNIKRGAPPTIILNGTADHLIPVEMVKYYKLVMESVESRCDLILYEGKRHGFFNYHRSIESYKETVFEIDKFLTSLGFIEGDPTIMDMD
jgi:acetyl esterase/lipase